MHLLHVQGCAFVCRDRRHRSAFVTSANDAADTSPCRQGGDAKLQGAVPLL